MKVTKKVFITPDAVKETAVHSKKSNKTGIGVLAVNTACCSNGGLLQLFSACIASDTFGKLFQRFSQDGGNTWSEPEVILTPAVTDEGVYRKIESCLLFDNEKDAVIHFYDYSLYSDSHYSADVRKYTRIKYRLSFDNGATFEEPVSLIENNYDEIKWARGIEYGRNCASISFCAPVKLQNNRIILPIGGVPIDFDPDDADNPYLVPVQAGCFIGEWAGDSISWQMSDLVKIDPKHSSSGLVEPAIAELTDGTLIMVMRASNQGITPMPGYKWISTSGDGGYTWSEAKPFTYSNGENFFSPATGSWLIRHSKTTKLYWIGNIVPVNPDGNSPRYPLQIAEVDENSKGIIKDSVFIIDDKKEEDSSFVQLSNFRVYEDNVTHDFVLHMSRLQEISENDITSPSYEYRMST